MVMQGHLTNKKNYIFIRRVPMATNLGRVITSLDVLLPIMPHDALITWPCENRDSLTRGGSAPKRLSRHRLFLKIFVTCK